MEKRDEDFERCVKAVKGLHSFAYCVLSASDVSWNVEGIDTAAVTVNPETKKIQFYVCEEFWNKLNFTEKVFLLLHEVYHVFLQHFTRFEKLDAPRLNDALDLAVNSSLMKNFEIDRKNIPLLSKIGVWADTVLPKEELMTCLSAEEYLSILTNHDKKNAKKEKNKKEEGGTSTGKGKSGGKGKPKQEKGEKKESTRMDKHIGNIDPKDVAEALKKAAEKMKGELSKELRGKGESEEKLVKKLEQELKKVADMLPRDAEDCKKIILSGTEAGKEKSVKEKAIESMEKESDPWKFFADQFKRKALGEKYSDSWIPDSRLEGLLPKNMSLPSYREQYGQNKIKVLLLLDTSGSCEAFVKHFIGFAEAIPKDLFEVHAYGFSATPYKIDLDNPRFYDHGCTFFHFFQDVYDEVAATGEAQETLYAFVFSDGYGTRHKVDEPELWSWFGFFNAQYGFKQDFVNEGSEVYKLEEFE